MNSATLETLSYNLIGNVPTAQNSAIKGCISGVVLFAVFEYAGFLIGEVPRIPVAWLMIPAAVMVESVLFFRLLRLLHEPRRCDIFAIARINYDNRLLVAEYAAKKANRAFLYFTGAVLLTAVLLEVVLIRERSIMSIAVIPGVCLLFMAGAGMISKLMIDRRVVPCSRRDATGSSAGAARNGIIRRFLARNTVLLSDVPGRWINGGTRLVLRRNLLYLLRGEILLSAVIVAGAPVIAAVLLFMIGNASSPFVSAIPLAAVFMTAYHFTSELEEAARILPGCFWYDVSARAYFNGNYFTLLIPSLPFFLVAVMFMAPTILSISGIVRLLNFMIAFAATVTIGCRGLRPGISRDADPLVGLMLFAVIMVGNFIPIAGALFSAAAVGVMVLLDGGITRKNGSPFPVG